MMPDSDMGRPMNHPLLTVSAPCRIDLGGTLDIATFHYPLQRCTPCTFNMAAGLRTHVRFYPFKAGKVRISSHGFMPVEFSLEDAGFNHPLGLMSAVAVYFQAQGLHIDIYSESPPRSALGGSSSAAVAMIAGLIQLKEGRDSESISRKRVALLAHALESSVAGVPCGMQDQLAAVYGGVNAWYWNADVMRLPYRRHALLTDDSAIRELEPHVLLAYCGEPHVSADINGQWVRQFLDGHYHREWCQMADCVHAFIDAVKAGELQTAVRWMNEETRIRRMMTPDVLDDMGDRLVDSALDHHCGARFTGAGGGGCVWALGTKKALNTLKPVWENFLMDRQDARLLDFSIDTGGLVIHEQK